jgi:hypothetical protein
MVPPQENISRVSRWLDSIGYPIPDMNGRRRVSQLIGERVAARISVLKIDDKREEQGVIPALYSVSELIWVLLLVFDDEFVTG